MRLTGMAVALLLGVILVGACACGGGTSVAFQTYTDEVEGYSISHPDTWAVTLWSFPLFSCAAPAPCEGYTPGFSVVREEIPDFTTLETYWTEKKQGLETMPAYTPVYEDQIKVGDAWAMKHIYTFVESEQGITVEAVQITLVTTDRGWSVLAYCAEECWGQYDDIFDTVVMSFRLVE